MIPSVLAPRLRTLLPRQAQPAFPSLRAQQMASHTPARVPPPARLGNIAKTLTSKIKTEQEVPFHRPPVTQGLHT